MTHNDLPPFDPKAKCIKCGNEIPDPIAPAPKFISTGAPTAQPPTVSYCNGEDCPWDEAGNGVPEHMHQFCDVCGYEWLSKPLG